MTLEEMQKAAAKVARNWMLDQPRHGSTKAICDFIAQAIEDIPIPPDPTDELIAENECLKEQLSLRDQRDRDMQEIMRINNELRAQAEKLATALEPFAKMRFHYDGYSSEMADIEFNERIAARVYSTTAHHELSVATNDASAALTEYRKDKP